jgi:hypothetical protein
MSPFLSAILFTMQPASGADCVYDALPLAQRSSIGEAMLAKRSLDHADTGAMIKAIDKCAPSKGWTTEGALHANGYAAMRSAADVLAGRLGHLPWSATALRVIRALPPEQMQSLAGTAPGNAEFKLVLTNMIAEDRSVATSLNGASDEVFTSFILMVKMIAVAEVERRKI